MNGETVSSTITLSQASKVTRRRLWFPTCIQHDVKEKEKHFSQTSLSYCFQYHSVIPDINCDVWLLCISNPTPVWLVIYILHFLIFLTAIYLLLLWCCVKNVSGVSQVICCVWMLLTCTVRGIQVEETLLGTSRVLSLMN